MVYYETNFTGTDLGQKRNKLFILSVMDVKEGMVDKILERCKIGVFFILPTEIHHPQIKIIGNRKLHEATKIFSIYISADSHIKKCADVINTILSLPIYEIKRFNSSFYSEDFLGFNPDSEDRPRILFVFPGTIYPRTLGSHQRAVSFLLSLITADIIIDILYTGPNPEERKRVVPMLNLLADSLCHYNNRAARRFSRSMRKKMGLMRSNKFDKQIARKVTPDLVNQLNKMCSKTNYDSIIVNYCWLLPAALEVKDKHPNVKIICDTHDVQFYRNGEENPESKEAKSELRWLDFADHIITISHRDEEILSRYVKKTKVSTILPTFDYLACYEIKSNANPMMFGFIGSDMQANVEALKYVINNWWPSILKFSPESKFFVAGSVCRNEEYQNISFLREGIETLGFVDNLNLFYKEIDMLLSPVVVRGGLNFKNAEVLVAGKMLLTNKNGADALKPLQLPYTAETAEDVINVLSAIARPDSQYREQSLLLAGEAQESFNTSNEKLKKIITA